jgi:hypothetical protein
MLSGMLIASDIGAELLQPPIGACFGKRSMNRAGVPEAPIQKNCETLTRERNIHCASPQPWYGKGDAKPNTGAVKRRPDGEFARVVLSTRLLHPTRRASLRYAVHLTMLLF